MVDSNLNTVAPEPQATPAAPALAQTPMPEPTPPAARVPINQAALDAQQPQIPQVRVIQPRSDGQIPINQGNFVVAQQDQSQIEPSVQTPQPPVQVSPSGADVVADPPPAAIPQAQPMEPIGWEALTNGQLKTQSDWETFQAEQTRLAAEVQQLTSTRVEFANPLAEKINNVFKNGGDMATVASLIAAQSLDPTSMKPLEAIKAAISLQHPDLDHEEIEAYIESKGVDFSNMESAGTRAALKTESAKAVQFLNSQKIQMDNPAVLAKAQESQADKIRNEEAWRAVPQPSAITKVNEKVGDVSVSIDYNLSQEAIAFAKNVTAEYQKSLPATQENIQNYHALFETMARGFDSQRLLSTVTAEAVRVATLEVQKRVAGPTPPPVPHAAPPLPSMERKAGHFALGGS